MPQPITGNTYPLKDQLRALGGRWDPERRTWLVPDDRAAEARRLVAGAVSAQPATGRTFRPKACKVCGVKAWNGRRGSASNGGEIIYRSGECRDCYEERKMGY